MSSLTQTLSTTGSVGLTLGTLADRRTRFDRFVVHLQGTYTSLVGVIEGSLDGTTYSQVAALRLKDNAWELASTIAPGNSAVENYAADCSSFEYMRFRVTSIGSGAVDATVSGLRTGLGLLGARDVTESALTESEVKTTTVTLSSAQILALQTTPVTVVPAQGANTAVMVDSVELRHAGGTAYANIAAGDDIAFKYTDASGAQCFTSLETTGLLDQTTAQIRHYPANTATPYAPVANAPVVASLGGAIDTGNFGLILKIRYRVVSTTFA